MEIEKKINLDSNWDKLYEFIKEGQWTAADEFCSANMRHHYHDESFLTACKCVRFWNQHYNENNEENAFSYGKRLIDLWASFSEHFSKNFPLFERGIHIIRQKVFSDALLQLLKANHENPNSALQEHFLLLIGRCYKFIGDFNKSFEILKRVYANDSRNSEVLAELADCCTLQGDGARGKLFFSEAFFYDTSKINLNFIETIYIKRLADLLSNEYNISKEELVDWIPVYATVHKIFNIRRELLPNEFRDLKQKIQILEDEEPEGVVIPRLIYAYCRFIFHLYATPQPDSQHYQIEILLKKIKALDSSIYNELIK